MPRSEGFATETSENGKREKSADYADFTRLKYAGIAGTEPVSEGTKASLLWADSCGESFLLLTSHQSPSKLVGAA